MYYEIKVDTVVYLVIVILIDLIIGTKIESIWSIAFNPRVNIIIMSNTIIIRSSLITDKYYAEWNIDWVPQKEKPNHKTLFQKPVTQTWLSQYNRVASH